MKPLTSDTVTDLEINLFDLDFPKKHFAAKEWETNQINGPFVAPIPSPCMMRRFRKIRFPESPILFNC